MNFGEERPPGRKSDHEKDKNEVNDAEAKTEKTINHRRIRKNDSAPKSKNSRTNSTNNRRSRSRSRSQSRQPSTASSKKSWKSANAWLNFMQHFRENLRNSASRRKNAFRLASEEWNEMTAEQKKPYIDAANKIKRQKEQENAGQRRKILKTKETKPNGKPGSASKVINKKKHNRDEENDDLSDSVSESETEGSAKTMESDNISVDSDASI